GEYAFDPQAGVMKSCAYKAIMTLNERNLTIRVPISISYHLTDAAQAAAYWKDQDEQRAKATEAAKLATERKPITDAEITQVLAELKSDKKFTARGAADRLAKSSPLETRRDEVA